MDHGALHFDCPCGRKWRGVTFIQEVIEPAPIGKRCDAPKKGSVRRCYFDAGHDGTHSWETPDVQQ